MCQILTLSHSIYRNGHAHTYVQPVTIQRTQRRGRPRKHIDKTWLADAVSPSHNLSISKVAQALGLHRETVRFYIDEHGLDHTYSNIPDDELDGLLRIFIAEQPSSGLISAQGYLRSLGQKVQRQRVRASLHRIDAVGRALRATQHVPRRKYSVPRCNHLWHIDGHHKLILWGFVIHGIIDGYNREVSVSRISLSECMCLT